MARVPAYIIERAIEARQRAAAIIGLLEDDAAVRVAEISLRTIDDLIEGALAIADPEVALIQLERIVEAAKAGQAQIMANLADDVFDLSLRASIETAAQFGTLSDRAIVEAAQLFTRDFRPDLVSASYQRWIDEVGNAALGPGSAVREAVERVAVRGGSLRRAVSDLLEREPTLASLPERNISTLARARSIVRNESTRIDNATSIGFAEASGVDKFVNIGVGDTRQSDICFEASKQPPMTLDAWRRSPWGLPPRHVANCRCQMMGVPGGYDPSDALLIEAGVIDA